MARLMGGLFSLPLNLAELLQFHRMMKRRLAIKTLPLVAQKDYTSSEESEKQLQN